METKTEGTYEGWVILEVMGHRKLGGYLKEQVIAGQAFIRIDVVDIEANATATQFYNPSSVYCITPTTQEVAISFGTNHQPAPVQRWELAALKPSPVDPLEYNDGEDEY